MPYTQKVLKTDRLAEQSAGVVKIGMLLMSNKFVNDLMSDGP